MKHRSQLLLMLLAVLLAVSAFTTSTTESYVRTPLSSANGTPIAWNLNDPSTPEVQNGRIVYNINQAGSDNVPFAQVEQAITSSFQAWEDVPTSAVAFTRGPNTNSTQTANDNLYQLFWLESSTNSGDGLNVAGVVALTRYFTITSGPRTGEITDAATAFNGVEFTWAVDGRAGAVDIAEVATHEIGHAIGLNHSPIGGAAMFPRTGPGRTTGRSLASDDIIGVSVAYPMPGFLSAAGALNGRVRDSGNAGVFGAHVAAVDTNGNVIAGALSQPDGSYAIQGLPPGAYTLYAEPLDPSTGQYFSKSDLTNFYGGITTDFLTSADVSVQIGAGQTLGTDIVVTRGTPALNAFLVLDPTINGYLNVATFVRQSASNVTIGVAGTGIPLSGATLSVSGPGVTILSQSARAGNTLNIIEATINITANAPPGARNLVVTANGQRSVVTGGLEILPGASVAVTTVSSADFRAPVAAESIATLFGTNLATTTVSGGSPLPTTLGGTSVRLRDAVGNERLAPLFFVSPQQINLQIAPGITIGNATVTVTSGSGVISTGSLQVDPVAPGIFAAAGNGQGLAAAAVLRVRGSTQTFEPLAQFNGSQFVPIPIDLGPETDQVFLVLFGTGIRFRSSLSAVTYNIGGVTGTPTYAGAQGPLTGLDQINIPLSRSLIGRGSVNVSLTVDGRTSNTVTVSVK